MTIISVTHNPSTNTITIVLPRKTITLVYQNLPPDWQNNPQNHEQDVVDFLNSQIPERTDRRIWLTDREFKPNDPIPFTDSERLWYDDVADEVVFVEVIVTEAIWSEFRQQYLIHVRNARADRPRI